ncbi:MAG: DNA-3-methyladenine glycosylase [Deltaproteobacteria bacterium]|nr:MAG: DNA-3-methyladenine glycosylase [Deltaproteobacteria bacterium]
MKILKRNFFERDTLLVARELLGNKLVRRYKGRRISGIVIETEAYLGTDDSASHPFKGKTRRNQVMFGPAGIAYVYFVYGMHYLFNVVTEETNNPCAVLLRAVMPLQGQHHMERLRGKRGKELTNGPAKLCQAMAIDVSLNGWDLTRGEKLWFENVKTVPENFICTGPRIGIDYAAKKDREAHRRFWVQKEFIAHMREDSPYEIY